MNTFKTNKQTKTKEEEERQYYFFITSDLFAFSLQETFILTVIDPNRYVYVLQIANPLQTAYQQFSYF